MDIVDEDQSGAQLHKQVADGVGDLRLVHPGRDGDAEEPGELRYQHLGVEAGGTARNATGRRSVRPVAALLGEFEGTAISSRVVVLPVVGGPDTISPRRAVPCWRRLRSISRRTDSEMRSIAGVVRTTNREW
ncbi:hypothetical protein BC342_00010 [Streptomyces olivaceus]|nr:hypothetical protein BC342_00010 [Streptomyces olivaceus]